MIMAGYTPNRLPSMPGTALNARALVVLTP